MRCNLYILLCFIFSHVLLYAEDDGGVSFKIGIEGGYDYFVGKFKSPLYERQLGSYYARDVYSNYNPFNKSDGMSSMSDWYAGVTIEALFDDERFGVTTGLRYTCYMADYEPDKGFYWDVTEPDAEALDFRRGEKITQRNHYVGFPLEGRFITGKNGQWVRFYLKLGSSWGFLMRSDKKIYYVSEKYEDGEIEDIGMEPDHFVGSIFPAFGFRIGSRYPLFNIDFHLPSFYVNMPAAYFLPDDGVGVQLSIQFPLSASSYYSKRPMAAPCKKYKFK